MSNRETKLQIINNLFNRGIFTKKVNDIQYYTRCPFCGDSKKNSHTGHFYIRINPNDNYPILYHCFKCPAEGVLNYETAELLGLGDIPGLKSSISSMNKTSDKVSNMSSDVKDNYFEYKVPDNFHSMKIQYIEKRLGREFSFEELKNMKVITSLKEFLKINNINTITCKPNFARLLENKYIGFLTNNNSHILFRDVTGQEKIRWFKYAITPESQGNRLFYSIKSSIDLYTDDIITINLSEGVMDAVSIAYNLNQYKENNLNIAVCGKFYTSVIKYLLSLGFIGDNIIINIYSDRDYTEDTSVNFFRKVLKKYSYLVKEINIIYNIKEKDCGVSKDKILLKKEKI